MSIIQLEIPNELAEKLRPYRNRLVELLELGLQKWQEREQHEHQSQQEYLLQVLASSDKITMPKPYPGKKPYISHTPVPITGKPASELIIEQRGPL
jgi:hypothetical protein